MHQDKKFWRHGVLTVELKNNKYIVSFVGTMNSTLNDVEFSILNIFKNAKNGVLSELMNKGEIFTDGNGTKYLDPKYMFILEISKDKFEEICDVSNVENSKCLLQIEMLDGIQRLCKIESNERDSRYFLASFEGKTLICRRRFGAYKEVSMNEIISILNSLNNK